MNQRELGDYSVRKTLGIKVIIALQLIFAFLFRCGKRRIRKKGGIWQ
jgi:hypothetical protein